MEIEKEFKVIEVESNEDGTVNITGTSEEDLITFYGCYPLRLNRPNAIPVSNDEIFTTIDYSFSRKEK